MLMLSSARVGLFASTANLPIDGVVGDVDGVESMGVTRNEVSLLDRTVPRVARRRACLIAPLQWRPVSRVGGRSGREVKSERCL